MKRVIVFLLATMLLVTPVFAEEDGWRGIGASDQSGKPVPVENVNKNVRSQDERDVFESTITIINSVLHSNELSEEQKNDYVDCLVDVCIEYYYNKLNKPFTVDTVNEILKPHGFQILSKIEK